MVHGRLQLLGLAVLLVACRDGKDPAADGAGEGLVIPDGTAAGERAGAPSVDFVVQGCTELTATRCTGSVPLRLTFAALLQSSFDGKLSWDLGDGSGAEQEDKAVVIHTYEEPGLYDVALTAGGAAGTSSALKPSFVEVLPAAAGSACAKDTHCRSQQCVCSGGSPCTFPLDGGLCLEACELSCQEEEMTCVDLSLAKGEAWRTHLCLPECASSSDCGRPGFDCAEAPGVKGWRMACVPLLLRPIGASCRQADGTTDPSVCIGGVCADLGASGYCSWACKAGTCPEGTRCAQLQGVDLPLCLVRCGGQAQCDTDPFLACELPGDQGPGGFAILGTQEPQGTRFCAPRTCTSDADCGLAGLCASGVCQGK